MTDAIAEAVHPVDAARLLGLLPTRPRLLALGEPTHGEDVLLDLRNDLFRQLAEEGYRTIAIESDCLKALLVDDYVTTGAGSLDDAMERGFSHGFGASAANRALVRWMRAHNENRPAAEHLRFVGFDGPLELTEAASPRPALTALHTYIATRGDADLLPCTAETLDRLLGADDRWTDPAAMTDPSRSVGQAPDAQRLRLITDDLSTLLDAQAPQLTANSSREEWHRARLYARTAVGLLRYHFRMADTSPHRMAWLLTLRASMMAANLRAVAQWGPALVHAHNGHLQRDRSSMRMGDMRPEWWSAGAIVNAYLGGEYAFVATALGTIPHHGVGTPPPRHPRRAPLRPPPRPLHPRPPPPARRPGRPHPPRLPLVRLRPPRPDPPPRLRRHRLRPGRPHPVAALPARGAPPLAALPDGVAVRSDARGSCAT